MQEGQRTLEDGDVQLCFRELCVCKHRCVCIYVGVYMWMCVYVSVWVKKTNLKTFVLILLFTNNF